MQASQVRYWSQRFLGRVQHTGHRAPPLHDNQETGLPSIKTWRRDGNDWLVAARDGFNLDRADCLKRARFCYARAAFLCLHRKTS